MLIASIQVDIALNLFFFVIGFSIIGV